jgi:hypothetical protein
MPEAALVLVPLLAAGAAIAVDPSKPAVPVVDRAYVIRVGPHQPITRIQEAARLAQHGAVIEIDAGDYPMDVASWPQNDLTIRAVGGRARLLAGGRSAEGKAVWVVKGDNVTIEHVEFSGALVTDENGAGIRHEGPGKLVIRDCRFTGNEMGMLSSNHPEAELVVERSEFDHNAVAGGRWSRDSIGHQIYVGRIARFTLRDSYIHHGMFGHLVKSRARENFLYNNRITDEGDGRASYELEFPEGGVAYVVGNIVQQGPRTENVAMIAFGAEGNRWARNELYLAHNTLVDDVPRGGIFVRVWPGARVISANNVLVGHGIAVYGTRPISRQDVRARPGDVPFARFHDYRLANGSALVNSATDPGEVDGISLRPAREYLHPRNSRAVPHVPYSPGALQSRIP